LNRAIGQYIDAYNQKKYQQRDCSRLELFNKIEKGLLKPLPIERFRLVKQTRAMVQKNCHIWLSEDKHYYSAPHKYIGQRVQVHYTSHDVEVYSNHVRIAVHIRNRKGHGYTTDKEHLSSTHRHVGDWSPKMFIDQAACVGINAKSLIEKFFEVKQHPEQAYKACQGILSLSRRMGRERLEKACERAMYYGNYSYRTVLSILDKELDCKQVSISGQTVKPIGHHDNIRGKDYYK
jgi:transposase